MAVNPLALISVTAIERCTPPSGNICSICQESFVEQAPNNGTGNDSSAVDIDEIEEVESKPVIIKMINCCPLDRVVAYGSMRVQQPAIDNVEFADFLGHEISEHDNGLTGVPLTGNERTTIEFPDSFRSGFPAPSDTGRSLDRDVINRANASFNSAQSTYASNEILGYTYYEVEDPSGYLFDHQYSDFEEIIAEGYDASEQSAND